MGETTLGGMIRDNTSDISCLPGCISIYHNQMVLRRIADTCAQQIGSIISMQKNPDDSSLEVPGRVDERDCFREKGLSFWWMHCIFRGFYVFPDMSDRKAVVHLTGTGRTFAKILFCFGHLNGFSTVNTDIFTWADLLSGFDLFAHTSPVHR